MFRSVGVAGVLAAARRIGWGGLALFCGWSLGVYLVLGAAWLAAAAGEAPARLPAFVWARLVREAVSDLLPLTQVGGLVIGVRTLLARGVPPGRVYVAMLIDLTTEMASQLVFTLVGVAMLANVLLSDRGASARPLVVGGLTAMAAGTIAFMVGQRWLLALSRRLAPRVLPGATALLEQVEQQLTDAYRHRSRILASAGLNLAGWFASAGGAWLAARLLGYPVDSRAMVAIESLVFAVRSVAFAVPAAVGVQETAYALIAPLFGLPSEAGLALSLVKRARDLAIGVPTLLLWQAGEVRGLARRPH